MSQHFLNRQQICAVFQQMGGKGMAQCVRCDLLLNPGHILVMLDDLPKSLAGHTRTIHINEKSAFLRLFDQLWTNMFDIVAQSPDRRGIKRNDPFFFSVDATKKGCAQVQMFQVQINKFTDPDPGGIEKFQHSLVTAPFWVSGIRLFQKEFHFLAGKDLGQLSFYLFQNQSLGGIERYQSLSHYVGIKGFERSQRPGNRRYRFSQAQKIFVITVNICLGSAFGRETFTGKPTRILGEIPKV